jgi:alcohol dehydrogenase
MLLAAATRVNITALRARDPDGIAIQRYAEAGRLLAGLPTDGDAAATDALVGWLAGLVRDLGLPRLRDVGVRPADLPTLITESRGSSMRTNPVVLTDAEIEAILTGSS